MAGFQFKKLLCKIFAFLNFEVVDAHFTLRKFLFFFVLLIKNESGSNYGR